METRLVRFIGGPLDGQALPVPADMNRLAAEKPFMEIVGDPSPMLTFDYVIYHIYPAGFGERVWVGSIGEVSDDELFTAIAEEPR